MLTTVTNVWHYAKFPHTHHKTIYCKDIYTCTFSIFPQIWKNNKNIKSLKKKSDTNFLYAERPAKLRSITNENMTDHQ
jgi:hypothetical protein